MHLPTKFHHPTFNHSEVTVLTKKQVHNIKLHFSMAVLSASQSDS